MTFDAVLFDFDGTVADTGKGIFAGIRYALDSLGLPPLEESVLRRFIGPPIWESFREHCGLNEDAVVQAVTKYREYYNAQGFAEMELYDGMEELLRTLSQGGVQTGVASSKPQHLVEKVAAHLGLCCDVLSGSVRDFAEDPKSAIIRRALVVLRIPADSRVLMVGDRRFDIQGAKEAGVQSAGALYGYGSRRELEEAGADYLIAAPMDLLSLVFPE